MRPADESSVVDPAELARLLAAAAALQAATPGALPDRLAWENDCLQLLDRAWPRAGGSGADEAIPVPDAVGRYKVIRELGRGGFGIVYLARDPNLGREVAVKVPLSGMIASPEVRRRFLREAQAVSGLDHPNIVPIHDAETVGPVAYIISAYCPGPSLAAWLKVQTEPVAPRVAARLVERIARGVAHAHDRGIWHRDLKPANIMLQPGGDTESGGMIPRVTDFGLAKLADGSGIDLSQTGLVIGSAPYMAPEQADPKAGEVGPATDVYALGATLYEILVGRPPFLGRSPAETLHLALNTDPIPPQVLRREVPGDLQTICLHALRKQPGHRYPTAAALGADLTRFLDDEPIQARPASRVERTWAWSRRHPGSATAILATVGLIGLISLGMAWSNAWLRSHNIELERAVARADRQATEAERQRRLVADREAINDRHRHAARLNLARRAIAAGQNERAQAILADPGPPGSPDRRDFAWHYLWNLARRDLALFGHHTNQIGRVVLAPDGATLASVDDLGQIRLWDVATLGLKFRFSGPPGPVAHLAFTPDGRRLAVVGASSEQPGANLQGLVHDVQSGHVLGEFALPALRRVEQLWFADASRALVAVGITQDGTRNILGWNLATPAEPGSPLAPRFALTPCGSVARSADSESIWIVEADGSLNQRAAATGRIVRTLASGLPELEALACSPDGRSLAGSLPTARVVVWDLKSGAGPQVVTETAVRPDELIFAPDSATLLVIAGTFQVSLIDLRGAFSREVLSFDPGRHGRLAFTFSPDGRWLVSAGAYHPGGTQPVTVWNVATGRAERVFPGRFSFNQARFDAASRAVLIANDYDLAVWPPFAPPGESVIRFDDHADEVWAVAIAPDGRTLASGGNDDRLRLSDPTTGARSYVLVGHTATVAAIAWHPNGQTIATGSLDLTNNLKLWDARTGNLINTLPGHSAQVRSVVFAPDGILLASTGSDGTIRLWEGATGQPLGCLLGHDDVVRGLAFGRDGRHLASVSNDRTVRIWDRSTQQAVAIFPERHQMSAVAYSPDGSTLAAADEEGFIYLRDTTTWRTRRVIQSDDREIRALAFSPDGESLVAAGGSRTIRIWDPVTGQPLLELDEGTSGQINALTFSPDGSLLIAADHGGHVLVYRGSQR